VREILLGLLAIAGERTDDLEVEYRAVRFRKTARNFLGEGLDIARFTIPLRQKASGWHRVDPEYFPPAELASWVP